MARSDPCCSSDLFGLQSYWAKSSSVQRARKAQQKGFFHVLKPASFSCILLEITYKHSSISGEYEAANCRGVFSINVVKLAALWGTSPPCVTPVSAWIEPPRDPPVRKAGGVVGGGVSHSTRWLLIQTTDLHTSDPQIAIQCFCLSLISLVNCTRAEHFLLLLPQTELRQGGFYCETVRGNATYLQLMWDYSLKMCLLNKQIIFSPGRGAEQTAAVVLNFTFSLLKHLFFSCIFFFFDRAAAQGRVRCNKPRLHVSPSEKALRFYAECSVAQYV